MCLSLPSKHSSWWRRTEDVFSVTFFCLPRRLEDIIARRLANTSWRRLEDVLKTSWRRLARRLEDILGRRIRRIANTSSRLFKTSSRGLGRQKVLRLEDVLENKKCLMGLYYYNCNTLFPGSYKWSYKLTQTRSV